MIKKLFQKWNQSTKRRIEESRLKDNEMICPDCRKIINVLTHSSIYPHQSVEEWLNDKSLPVEK